MSGGKLTSARSRHSQSDKGEYPTNVVAAKRVPHGALRARRDGRVGIDTS